MTTIWRAALKDRPWMGFGSYWTDSYHIAERHRRGDVLRPLSPDAVYVTYRAEVELGRVCVREGRIKWDFKTNWWEFDPYQDGAKALIDQGYRWVQYDYMSGSHELIYLAWDKIEYKAVATVETPPLVQLADSLSMLGEVIDDIRHDPEFARQALWRSLDLLERARTPKSDPRPDPDPEPEPIDPATITDEDVERELLP